MPHLYPWNTCFQWSSIHLHALKDPCNFIRWLSVCPRVTEWFESNSAVVFWKWTGIIKGYYMCLILQKCTVIKRSPFLINPIWYLKRIRIHLNQHMIKSKEDMFDPQRHRSVAVSPQSDLRLQSSPSIKPTHVMVSSFRQWWFWLGWSCS